MRKMKSTSILILMVKIFIMGSKIIKLLDKKKKISMNKNLKVSIIIILVLKSILNLYLHCLISPILLIKGKNYKIAIN